MSFMIAELIMEFQLQSESTQTSTDRKQETVSSQVFFSDRSLSSKADESQSEGASSIDEASADGFIAKFHQIGYRIRKTLKRSHREDPSSSSIHQSIPFHNKDFM